MRKVCFSALLVIACGSDPDEPKKNTTGGCPSIAGTWTVTAHCDASLLGMRAVVTQDECTLAFEPPFDTFAGTVSRDGTITLTGPQSCEGSEKGGELSLVCTPGTCVVKLSE